MKFPGSAAVPSTSASRQSAAMAVWLGLMLKGRPLHRPLVHPACLLQESPLGLLTLHSRDPRHKDLRHDGADEWPMHVDGAPGVLRTHLSRTPRPTSSKLRCHGLLQAACRRAQRPKPPCEGASREREDLGAKAHGWHNEGWRRVQRIQRPSISEIRQTESRGAPNPASRLRVAGLGKPLNR